MNYLTTQVSLNVNEYLGNISLTDQWLLCTDIIINYAFLNINSEREFILL